MKQINETDHNSSQIETMKRILTEKEYIERVIQTNSINKNDEELLRDLEEYDLSKIITIDTYNNGIRELKRIAFSKLINFCLQKKNQ